MSRPRNDVDVAVVGAGQAGLSVSWYLELLGIEHVVLEAGRVGETWRSQRWDSFHLVTPAWMTRLPGLAQPQGSGDEFTARDDLVSMFEQYATALPVQTGVRVISAGYRSGRYRLTTSRGDLRVRAVVAASGAQRRPVVPSVAGRISDEVTQLHTSDYRNPHRLPPGSVLVVGGGQSGAQIAEELVHAGRQVFLATSKVGRIPRRYRGRDAHDWAHLLGNHDRTVDQVEPGERAAANPLLTGAGGGHTLALQQLARDGVVLLGRMTDAKGTVLRFGDDLLENVRFGDQQANAFRRTVDAQIERLRSHADAPDIELVERPQHDLATSPLRLSTVSDGISTIIWCVGFGPDTAWIDVPVLDPVGNVMSTKGITRSPAFYTLGAPWLSHRGSGILYGVATDASQIALDLASFLRAAPASQEAAWSSVLKAS
jgi:putative flavoprotein involved in K+ transport